MTEVPIVQNQQIKAKSKSMNWFLYDRELCNERVKLRVSMKVIVKAFVEFSKKQSVLKRNRNQINPELYKASTLLNQFPQNGQTRQTIRWRLLANCMDVFNHFVGSILKGSSSSKNKIAIVLRRFIWNLITNMFQINLKTHRGKP